ncbi:hypothetical protein [[Eubacterium] cellulosolvens]
MKSGIHAGAISGAIAGIVGVVFSAIFGNLGIIEVIGGPEIWDFSLMVLFSIAFTTLALIWGLIFGGMYTIVQDSIPRKGVIKGLIFGIMIWVIKDISAGSFLYLVNLEYSSATRLILIGLPMWIAYGLVIGYLYKPPK